MSNNTVYIITTGVYSDFRIQLVCSTKEKAEKVKQDFINTKHNCYDYVEIHEFKLDEVDDAIDLFDKGLQLWQIRWIDDFRSVETSRVPLFVYKEQNVEKFGNLTWVDEKGNPVSYGYRTCCLARNEEHALKIALERFIKFKAEKGATIMKEI